jgi:hypothetical protein
MLRRTTTQVPKIMPMISDKAIRNGESSQEGAIAVKNTQLRDAKTLRPNPIFLIGKSFSSRTFTFFEVKDLENRATSNLVTITKGLIIGLTRP